MEAKQRIGGRCERARARLIAGVLVAAEQMSGVAPEVATMSVTLHDNRKSRGSLTSANVSLFHKPSHPDAVLAHLNAMRKQRMLTDVTLRAGDRSFPCHR